MEISVQGQHEEFVRPEIGRLHASVDAEAHNREDVLSKVTEVVGTVSAELKRLQSLDAAPVREVVVRPITTSSWRPSNRGKLLPAQYTARSTLRADFTDFNALADLVAAFGAVEGLNLQYVEWRLTEDTRRRIEGECVTRAVIAARERAQVMAAAAGAGEVAFVQLSDPGLLSDGAHPAPFAGGGPEFGMMRSKAAMDVQGIEIQPDDLVIAATVQARFSA